MEQIFDLLPSVGSIGIRLFWLPLLAWSLLAGAGLLLLRRFTALSARVQYQAHLALLLALPLSFLLAPLLPNLSSSPHLPAVITVSTSVPETAPATTLQDDLIPLPALASEPSLGPLHLVGLLTLAAGVSAGAFLLLLLFQLALVRRLRLQLENPASPHVAEMLVSLAREAGLPRPVRLGLAPAGSVPMTFGWRHPVVLLPPSLLSDEAACRLVLHHEVIHIRNNDYLWGLIERFCCGLFAIHPGVWLLQERIAFYREAACDAEVLAQRPSERAHYARLLFSFARSTVGVQAAVLPMGHPAANLKNRISAMKRISPFTTGVPTPRHFLLIGALLLIPALVAACTVSVDNSDSPKPVDQSFDSPTLLADAMPEVEIFPAEANYELQRLKVQIDYLTEQLENLSTQFEGLEDQPFIMKEQLLRRAELLQSMYMQRLEAFETMRLEAETERRLKKDKGYQKMRSLEMEARKEAEFLAQREQVLQDKIQMLNTEVARRELYLINARNSDVSKEDLKRAMVQIEELKARIRMLQAE